MILIILNKLGNMPWISTLLKTFLILSLFLSASIFFLFKVHCVKTLRYYTETVNIQRNQFGIPYVKANSLASALYGWGYVTAQDRIFQLAFKRLVAKGKLSKYLGKKALNVDKLFRQINLDHWAQRTAQRLYKQNHTQYQNLNGYVKGINDYVKSLNFLPLQFHLIGLKWQKWYVSDLFLQAKLLVWSQSMNMGQQYLRSSLLANFTQEQVINFIPFGKQKWDIFNLITIVTDEQISQKLKSWTHSLDVPKFKPQEINNILKVGLMDYIDDGRGSNSWVIGGKHTQSGYPLIANDPHLQSAIPHQWYQLRIQYIHQGKTVYWQGPAMTGIPVIVGKTQYMSLALTTIHTDCQDLYKQKVEGNYYFVDGQKFPLKKRIEIIEVQNQQPVQYIVQETHRGPIIHFVPHWGALYQLNQQSKISMAWTGFHDDYQIFVKISHAAEFNDINDVRNFFVKSSHGGPNMNALYATVDNNIGYWAIGTLPKRRNPFSGNFIKDGSTSEHDWIGFIKNQDQLHLENPQKGYIVTANNKPSSAKYHNGAYDSSMLTARANRIDQMIRQKIQKGKKLNVQDMKRMQLDTIDILCQQNLPSLLQGIENSQQYLKGFDCNFTKLSYQATIYQTFFYQLYKIINPAPEHKFNLMASSSFFAYLHRYIRNYNIVQNYNNMNKAFENTIKNLTDFYSTSNKQAWVWQKYHPDVIIHRPFSGSDILKPFYEKRFGGRGNINTINVAKMCKLSYGDFTVNHRANIRSIWTHAPTQKSYFIADTGISQKFYSKHYDDQFKLFTRDQYIQVDFKKQQIKQQQL